MDGKGFAYLLTVSILLGVIILVFLTVNHYTHTDEQEIVQLRIQSMNNFIIDFNKDIHRASYIAGFRAMLALEDYVSSNSIFLNDTEVYFKEAFYNGTIDGTHVPIMNDSTLFLYIDKVNEIADDIGLHSNISVINITLNQSSAWAIDVYVYATVTVLDSRDLASWAFNKTYKTEIPIFDLRDPLYSHFTSNRIPNPIRKLDDVDLVNFSDNDTTNLITHINNSYYRASTSAPSFLQRFSNNISPSPFGIESIVNIETFSDQELTVYSDRIKVDYMYFNDESVGTLICNISTVPESWKVILPYDRLNLYNLSGINYSTSCP